MNEKSIKEEPRDHLFPLMEDLDRTCPGQLEVPTPREQKALAAMRAIKDQVRPLKDRLAAIRGAGRDEDAEAIGVKTELARLKKEWDLWKAERKAAAKERMILLGHEEAE
jgi:chromosome segregation ATPase